LRDLGWFVAYNGFAGGKAQILEKKNVPPDYLMLAPSLLQGLPRNVERQRQLEAVVRASRDIGAEVIASGVENKDEAKICRDAGCRFAQGDFISAPRHAAHRGPAVAAVSGTKIVG
jgi:EAL domain-containing protein (putative c-di-GMP-specific phosphodiesterase class I)